MDILELNDASDIGRLIVSLIILRLSWAVTVSS